MDQYVVGMYQRSMHVLVVYVFFYSQVLTTAWRGIPVFVIDMGVKITVEKSLGEEIFGEESVLSSFVICIVDSADFRLVI